MKYFTIAIILFVQCSYAQLSLESSFNSVHIGRNQNLLVKYDWEHISINAGVKYNFNKEADFPLSQAHFFKKTFWAIDFGEHMGVELGLQLKFLKKEHFELFGFYQAQLTKSHIRHEVFYAHELLVDVPQSEFDYSYIKHQNFIGPIWAAENNFGIGMNFRLLKGLYVTVKGGGGILFWQNMDPNVWLIGSGNWELSEMVSFGVGYTFNKKEEGHAD